MTAQSKRLVFGAVLSVVLVGILVGEGWLSVGGYLSGAGSAGCGFAVIAALLSAVACRELWRLVLPGQSSILSLMATGAVVLIVTQPCWSGFITGDSHAELMAGVLIGLFLLICLVQGIVGGVRGVISNIGLSCLSMLYLGLGMWFVVMIRKLGGQAPTLWGQIGLVTMFIVSVKSCDIGAYFIGKAFGRHPWVPAISPKKTWEGFFGGMLIGTVVASLFSLFSGIIPIGVSVVFGVVVSLSGQLGDLLESMLKRDAGSKDSAKMIPEFGGMLDLIDSVIVASPFGYLVLLMAGAST